MPCCASSGAVSAACVWWSHRAPTDRPGEAVRLSGPPRSGGRHRHGESSGDRRRAARDSAAGGPGSHQHGHHPRRAGQGGRPPGCRARQHRRRVRARLAHPDAGAHDQPASGDARAAGGRPGGWTSGGAARCFLGSRKGRGQCGSDSPRRRAWARASQNVMPRLRSKLSARSSVERAWSCCFLAR
jgi:hypothetical protein